MIHFHYKFAFMKRQLILLMFLWQKRKRGDDLNSYVCIYLNMFLTCCTGGLDFSFPTIDFFFVCLPVVVHLRETCSCNVWTVTFSQRSKAAVSCHRLGDKHVTSIYAETLWQLLPPVPSGSRVKKRAPHGCLLYFSLCPHVTVVDVWQNKSYIVTFVMHFRF